MAPKAEVTSKRSTPRRLFSFDSIKSSPHSHPSNLPAQATTLVSSTDSDVDGDLDAQVDKPWSDKEIFDSPRAMPRDLEETSTTTRSSSPHRDHKSRSTGRLDSLRPAPLSKLASRNPSNSSQLSSPSRARWEHLRQHVVPNLPAVNPQEPGTSSQPISPPPRAPTPKPSRFARLGFRQVVEHAREAVGVDMSKFAHEVQSACWASRYVEPARVKLERDAQNLTMASTLHLPFGMSTPSLPSLPNNSTNYQPTKRHDIRRPQSIQSSASSSRSSPSVRPLYQVIVQRSSPSIQGLTASTLPHESSVLSVLLWPFTSASLVDEEMWLAIETFELIVKAWNPVDEVAGVERGLWCCKAASIPPSPIRMRILRALCDIVVSPETNYPATSSETFQAIVQGLFALVPHLAKHPFQGQNIDEENLINDMLNRLCAGCCGDVDVSSLETEYNAICLVSDDANKIREALVLEGLSRALENVSLDYQCWLLRTSAKSYWHNDPLKASFTPLLTGIYSRALSNLTRAFLAIIQNPRSNPQVVEAVIYLLKQKVIPTIDSINGKVVADSRRYVNQILVCLLSEGDDETKQWGTLRLLDWYRNSPAWKDSLHAFLKFNLEAEDWTVFLKWITSLNEALPDDIVKSTTTYIFPFMCDRLVENPPPFPCPALTNFLESISHRYPQVFYRPLFSCAASSKEYTVVNHLCIITMLARFLPDFWTRDAEMISVALMNDIGSTRSGQLEWGKARLGQSIILLELIAHLQSVRHAKEAASALETFLEPVKFVLSLEARLGVLFEAKEAKGLIHPSQRLLFCVLLREIRLLTKSLKSAAWLNRVVSWVVAFYAEDDLNEASDLEVSNAVEQVQQLYATAQEGVRTSSKRKSVTLVLARPSTDNQIVGLAEIIASRTPLIASIAKGFIARAMKLLVAVSTLLTPEDYQNLAPHLWYQGLMETNSSAITSACFLVMQCAEKTPMELLALIEVDLQSSDDATKLEAMRKINTLTNWRYQIMSQQVVMDRTRRPFKLSRGPLPFVATDIGSSSYIQEYDSNQPSTVPQELKKRLAEIGWAQEETPIDEQHQWIRTPMSLLPSYQLDRIETSATQDVGNPSVPKDDSIEQTLLRRNSSSGGPSHSGKRRAVFVPSLTSIFPRLAALIYDPNFAVASSARTLLMDLMRNDPNLLTRPVFDLFSGEQKDVNAAIIHLRAYLYVRSVLPPVMAHNIFNHLAGFLKYSARQLDVDGTFQDFSLLMPIISGLITQVSGMSIREIRRAKVEAFFVPSGSLWFTPSAPIGPMFPRDVGTLPPAGRNVPPRIVPMTMIRISQNLLFLSMLKRNPQDVQLIRKHMARLVLPTLNGASETTNLDMVDFVPKKAARPSDGAKSVIGIQSLLLSRSYILLVAQIFRSMSRHLSDRTELAVLVDGLNRILLTHGDDIGIISQCLIALMVASTRFRRLFTSGGGYTLVMPAVIKVYTENESNSGIRHAIEYSINRFYSLHREAFVFQTLDVTSHIATLSDNDEGWLAKNVFDLFFTLSHGVPPTVPDAAGIHGANKSQEREALIVSAVEDKPQTFLASVRNTDHDGANKQLPLDAPEEHQSSRLPTDDFVRLFLTVIAHDPGIQRAQHFLRLFRHLSPFIYRSSSSARQVLHEGVDALCVVLFRASTKAKLPESTSSRSVEELAGMLPLESVMERYLVEKAKKPSDLLAMRLDYLTLVVEFTRAGGQVAVNPLTRIVDLVRFILKDSSREVTDPISTFLSEFSEAFLSSSNPPNVQTVVIYLSQLATLMNGEGAHLNFDKVFYAVANLVQSGVFAREAQFSQVVVNQICTAGLDMCETSPPNFSLHSCLATLIRRAAFIRGADVFTHLEKRQISYPLLVNVVLPLALTLDANSTIHYDAQSDTPHHDTLARSWVRLLSYAMKACEKSQKEIAISPSPRLKTHDRRASADSRLSKSAKQPTFFITLQILKVVLIRGETDFSQRLPGVWTRVAAFLRSTLSPGDASFAFRGSENSPSPSPAPSPRASGVEYFDHSPSSTSIPNTFPERPQPLRSPRLIDYATWSFLELLCVHRNPLTLQMRQFIQEKIAKLDEDLQFGQSSASPIASSNASTANRRVSTAMFSKNRRRVSANLSAASGSPDVSMMTTMSSASELLRSPRTSTIPHDASFNAFDDRQPGYQNITTPTMQEAPVFRIVHLGPVSPGGNQFRASYGHKDLGLPNTIHLAHIRSLVLVRETYRRIRLVQACMGYGMLLPVPDIGDQEEFAVRPLSLTKYQAINSIVSETKQVIEEFENSFRRSDDFGSAEWAAV